jgi:hypothetical protein
LVVLVAADRKSSGNYFTKRAGFFAGCRKTKIPQREFCF